MPSYQDDPPDQEYLDSIKKHTDKETNQVNLALVGKDFGYSSGKSFQKKYAKLKKAYKLTNGHIYGDYRPGKSSTKAATPKAATPKVATPEAFTPETLTPEAATPEATTPEATRTPPKKTTKKSEDTLTPEVKGYLRTFITAWAQALKERDEQERDDMKKVTEVFGVRTFYG
ncbi:hypothetical protein PENPOL_c003G02382 [Penicillium polonicum]|uniref:Uncharacterized protein n=1 Tax=Penicillium polonicum TaxID=60169 RepID=A0A1V6NT98_PENPO|nr:hypothetical protein PENPOL_c003G02382 [Penicillium polonicum]